MDCRAALLPTVSAPARPERLYKSTCRLLQLADRMPCVTLQTFLLECVIRVGQEGLDDV